MMHNATVSTPYRPSPRIAALRERVMAQPVELFFGLQRNYFYLLDREMQDHIIARTKHQR
ncbi:MAG: hypothetical protein ACYDBB_16890 [Armatimonadota bacterium]